MTRYMTYAEIAQADESQCRQKVVKNGLTLDQALNLVQELGFGYSAHITGT